MIFAYGLRRRFLIKLKEDDEFISSIRALFWRFSACHQLKTCVKLMEVQYSIL